MRCDSCGKTLIKIDRRTELTELDEDATDGQMRIILPQNYQETMAHGALGSLSIVVQAAKERFNS